MFPIVLSGLCNIDLVHAKEIGETLAEELKGSNEAVKFKYYKTRHFENFPDSRTSLHTGILVCMTDKLRIYYTS